MGGIVVVVYQDDVRVVHAHTRLTGNVGKNGRHRGIIHDLDVVAAFEELHLPAQQGRSRYSVVGGGGELNHAHAVGCGADHLVIHIAAVGDVAVAPQHVDLRTVGVGIGATKRGVVATCSRHGSAQTQVTVRVDGELRVVGAREVEGESDVRHGGGFAVASAGDKVGGVSQLNPLGRVSARRHYVVRQDLREPAYAQCDKHKHNA